MTKRLISANTSEIFAMTKEELKQSIQASEGRVILSENVVLHEPVGGDITNAEVAKAFGADLILLNGFDVFHPMVLGLYPEESSLATAKPNDHTIQDLKKLVGRPIGVNLEPVDPDSDMLEERLTIALGRQANVDSLKKAKELGFDFICLTGNPGTGVTNKQIEQTIQLAKKHFNGLIIAGKMHSAGVAEPTVDMHAIHAFINSGADIILVPAIGTVPGIDFQLIKEATLYAHEKGALVVSAIGTSQESANVEIIQQIALQNKMAGVDIQHIGDAGYAGVAPVENITAMSDAIRGKRHTISRIARSINR